MAASGASVAALRRLVPVVVVLVLLAPARGNDNNNTELAAAAAGGGGGTARPRQCAYTVKIKTSCASPRRTSDAVSLAFGDTYRNEAYVRRLPSSGRALERCGTDTLRVWGTRGYGVCYLNLRRSGRDGWVPEWVQVVQPGRPPVAVMFYFGNPLSDGVWYGHNRCARASAAAAGKPSVVVDAGNSSALP